jgi:hypothetical protein
MLSTASAPAGTGSGHGFASFVVRGEAVVKADFFEEMA